MSNILPEVKPSQLENHVQTIMQFIIVGLLAWFGTSVQALQVQVASLKSEQTALASEISRMRDFNNDRYPGSQARTDLSEIRAELRNIDRRLSIIEAKNTQ